MHKLQTRVKGFFENFCPLPPRIIGKTWNRGEVAWRNGLCQRLWMRMTSLACVAAAWQRLRRGRRTPVASGRLCLRSRRPGWDPASILPSVRQAGEILDFDTLTQLPQLGHIHRRKSLCINKSIGKVFTTCRSFSVAAAISIRASEGGFAGDRRAGQRSVFGCRCPGGWAGRRRRGGFV